MTRTKDEIISEINRLPKGYITRKVIGGRTYHYHQWKDEDGKAHYVSVGPEEAERLRIGIETRKALQKQLKAAGRRDSGMYPEEIDTSYGISHVADSNIRMPYTDDRLYHLNTNALTGDSLREMAKSAEGLEKRDCFPYILDYLYGRTADRVCILYGLRRTGKTTLIRQALLEMDKEDFERSIYIKATRSDTLAGLNQDMKLIRSLGYKYVFIDEITMISGFIDSASLFSDIYAAGGMKIVLSGTDSLGFWMSLTNELYDRAWVIHTTFIPFREHSRLLGVIDIDDYIRYGGTLQMGETDFGDEDLMSPDAPFRDDESTRRYIDTAICKNIQHSLECFEQGRYFRHLRELYDNDELTGAINRIVEKMNHRFVLQTLIERFESHDLGSAAELLRKQPDDSGNTDILDHIDRKEIARKLMEILEIRDAEDQQTRVTEVHVREIKEYLHAIDLIMDCPSETVIPGSESSEYILFTQPGMRYVQAQALVYVLINDDKFASFGERDRELATEQILEDVRGRMMEDIILLETARSKMRSGDDNLRSDRCGVFKLRLSRNEIDMVIRDAASDSCKLYEIKHSREIVPRQYQVLEDEQQLAEVEKRFGAINGKYVIYRGPTVRLENGIEYLNAEEYLSGL